MLFGKEEQGGESKKTPRCEFHVTQWEGRNFAFFHSLVLESLCPHACVCRCLCGVHLCVHECVDVVLCWVKVYACVCVCIDHRLVLSVSVAFTSLTPELAGSVNSAMQPYGITPIQHL